MVEVLFFASLREQLGIGKLSLALPTEPLTILQFKQYLIDQNDANWATILLADNVISALNQHVVADDHPVKDGDELAFFPPVTGG